MHGGVSAAGFRSFGRHGCHFTVAVAILLVIAAVRLVLQPTAELTQLIQTLFGIEERAKLYYISSGKTSGDDPKPEPEPEPKPDEGGDDEGGERLRVGEQSSGMVTPVTPE